MYCSDIDELLKIIASKSKRSLKHNAILCRALDELAIRWLNQAGKDYEETKNRVFSEKFLVGSNFAAEKQKRKKTTIEKASANFVNQTIEDKNFLEKIGWPNA